MLVVHVYLYNTTYHGRASHWERQSEKAPASWHSAILARRIAKINYVRYILNVESIVFIFPYRIMTPSSKEPPPSQLIDQRIAELGDWRGEALAHIRAVIKQALPNVVEEWKWRGVPVWSHNGIVCTGETYKNAVKMTFAKGASLKDPKGLFNASLDGNTRRAIDVKEGDMIDDKALEALITEAAKHNAAKSKK